VGGRINCEIIVPLNCPKTVATIYKSGLFQFGSGQRLGESGPTSAVIVLWVGKVMGFGSPRCSQVSRHQLQCQVGKMTVMRTELEIISWPVFGGLHRDYRIAA